MSGGKTDHVVGSLHERELNGLKKMAAHNDIAFAAAMSYCVQWNVEPPRWLVEGATRLLIELLKREKSAKRGRAVGRINRYRQDLCDIERWDAVLQIRELKQRIKHEAEVLAAHAKTFEITPEFEKSHTERIRKAQQWFRHGTFECASRLLIGTEAFGSPVTVKKSYQRFTKAMRNESFAHRYHLLWGDFTNHTGLAQHGFPKGGQKIAPIWELYP